MTLFKNLIEKFNAQEMAVKEKEAIHETVIKMIEEGLQIVCNRLNEDSDEYLNGLICARLEPVFRTSKAEILIHRKLNEEDKIRVERYGEEGVLKRVFSIPVHIQTRTNSDNVVVEVRFLYYSRATSVTYNTIDEVINHNANALFDVYREAKRFRDADKGGSEE